MRKLIRPSQQELEELRQRYSKEQSSQVKRARIPRDDTGKEAKFLRECIDRQVPVRIKLRDGREVTGVIEYYDQSFIRLTVRQAPNEFIYKKDILYLQPER
ncbi:MAG: RNA chaperone Hfq [Acidobacteria bacterium]|nr:RNA chaperone Hfq [Acidobacteriota bacterium]